ncbi:MAG: hypothetical protein U1A24_06835 [Cypionkella sp.]|nr:hypothetical protein [Cypionkella sp.]MDZ4310254.1 hypothetical protein [Cypionkella sp.]MDZ4393590.1 hypothetical protein [Cypionkella sp.]
MKITAMKTFIVPPRWLFLKIETEEGVSDWREPLVKGRALTVEAAVHELADYLIGQRPAPDRGALAGDVSRQFLSRWRLSISSSPTIARTTRRQKRQSLQTYHRARHL